MNGNYEEICSFGSPNDGVELYCVQMTIQSFGMTTTRGAVVQGTEPALVYAHEFGHLCDLRDIYMMHPPETTLAVGGGVEWSRLPIDWPSNAEEGYYSAGLSQSNIIRRLLMFPGEFSGQADLSAGDIYGLWNDRFLNLSTHQWTANYVLGEAPVGFFENGIKQPIGD